MAENIVNECTLEGNSSQRESTKVPSAQSSDNNLGALYECISIHLHKVINVDDASDAVMCSRMARIAADRFRKFRDEETKLSVALRCEKLFDIDALLHGAHDVSDATRDRRALLGKAMQAVDRATDILGRSPDWNADDLMASPDRPCRSEARAAPDADPWRVKVAQRAAWEIEAIAALVEERLRGGVRDQGELALRSMLRRAARLASAQMTALSGDECTEADLTTIVDRG